MDNYVPRYAPAALYRRVQATLERGWAGRREVAVSAALTQERPRAVDYDFIDSIVRLGCESYASARACIEAKN